LGCEYVDTLVLPLDLDDNLQDTTFLQRGEQMIQQLLDRLDTIVRTENPLLRFHCVLCCHVTSYDLM
jgi:hypothetical protein